MLSFKPLYGFRAEMMLEILHCGSPNLKVCEMGGWTVYQYDKWILVHEFRFTLFIVLVKQIELITWCVFLFVGPEGLTRSFQSRI